jgi:transcriptional regulator with XRE-family HTH domain
MNFGKTIKTKRLIREVTLRQFCRDLGIDASYWSKVERDLMPAPRSIEQLEKIANYLNIDIEELLDLAGNSWLIE